MNRSPIDRPNIACKPEASPTYEFRHGEFDITILSDGYIKIPAEILVSDARPDERVNIMNRLPIDDGMVRLETNIPLLRRGDEIVVIDVGAGTKYQPTDGKLCSYLSASHIDPMQVTKVAFTHAHPDHIWGTLDDEGSLLFPNATYYVGEAEWAFWMDPDYETNMPSVLHDFARGAQRDLAAVRDRAVFLKPGDEVITGMRALDTAGHTPGHLSFELSGGDGLIITADATTNQKVALEHPEWKLGYDTIPELAVRNRIRLVDRAASERVKLLGYHWTSPGIGYVERWRGGTRFVPV
jgi:glyoxylase-like metal-dependent hydrolase (beta-lactamase superfamily II)